MKRILFSMAMVAFAWQSMNAMSYERAREEAIYLTDKMAYELNLNDQQYNDAYEINLDYLMSLESERDLYGSYLEYRLTDFRHILYDWQYDLMLAADYFVRPVIWRTSGWYFPIYSYYRRGLFYFDWPGVYWSYRGGHGHFHYHGGFYVSRRPVWSGGMRGMGHDRRGWNNPAPRSGRGSMGRPHGLNRDRRGGDDHRMRGGAMPSTRSRGDISRESRSGAMPSTRSRSDISRESRSGAMPSTRSRSDISRESRSGSMPSMRSSSVSSPRGNIFRGSSTRSTVGSTRSSGGHSMGSAPRGGGSMGSSSRGGGHSMGGHSGSSRGGRGGR